jgi:hypothetical protein
MTIGMEESRAFVLLGHGHENIDKPRQIVPPGCTLVVSEECGTLGVIPEYLFDAFQDPQHGSTIQ